MLLVPLLELALIVLVDLGVRPLVIAQHVQLLPMLLMVPPTPVLVPLLVVFLPVKLISGKILLVLPMYVKLLLLVSHVVKPLPVALLLVVL